MQPITQRMLSFFCLIVLFNSVAAQGQHPLTDIPAPGEVQTAYNLPNHPSKQFPAGEQIPILVGFHNSASREYNVTYIMGSLILPMNNMYIQNFSYYAYFAVVPPSQELTFEYSFRPDRSLTPMELRVALTMFYGDKDGQSYASTFFNETIDIVEKPSLIDYELLWMYTVMLAIAGAAIYAVVSWVMGMTSTGKRGGQRKTAKKTTDESQRDDWLSGTPSSKYAKQS